MSSSVPPTNDYQRMTRALEDMSQGYERQLQKERKAREHDVSAARRTAEIEARRSKEDAEETIGEARASLLDQASRERASSRREIDRIKASTYDKNGKVNSSEVDSLRQQLEDTRAASEQARDQDQRHYEELKRSSEYKLRKMTDDNNETTEKALRAYRDSVNSESERETRVRKEAEMSLIADARDKYRRLNDQRLAEHNESMRQLNKIVQEHQARDDHDALAARNAEESRINKAQDNYRDSLELAVKQGNDARERESSDLRSQLWRQANSDNIAKKSVANYSEEFTREHAREIQQAKEKLIAERDASIEHERERSSKVEDNLNEKRREVLAMQEARYGELFREREKESHDREVVLRKNYQLASDQQDLRMRREREQALHSLERQAESSAKSNSEAMLKVSEAHQKASARQRQALSTQINDLKQRLQTKSTTSDPNEISAAAEETIRKSVASDAYKVLEADHERDRRNIDSLQENYARRMDEVVEEAQHSMTRSNQRDSAERHHERTGLMDQIYEVETSKRNALKQAESQSERERDQITRKFSDAMERQRKQYDQLLEDHKNDSLAKLQMTRREHELATKTNARAFNEQKNELIRDYEKRLADQKVDLESKVDTVRQEGLAAVREAERKAKLTAEDLVKSYEFRIATLEQQHKERERMASVNYEEQLDRARRSYALSSKKA